MAEKDDDEDTGPAFSIKRLHSSELIGFAGSAILLLAACVAPFILAYIIARGHELTWRPGEVTMIVGMIAFALILLNGVILGRPGEEPDNVDISLRYGYLIGMLGALGIAVGGFVRQAKAVRSRKPPGVL